MVIIGDFLVNFTAGAIETKSHFGTHVENASTVATLWDISENIGVSLNLAAPVISTDFVAANDGTSATFKAELTDDEATTKHIYAVSPYNDYNVDHSATGFTGTSNKDNYKDFYVVIPETQTSLATSCDRAAQLIMAETDVESLSENVNLVFAHKTAYGVITLNDLALESGETVSEVKIEADESVALTGDFYYYLGGTSVSNELIGTLGKRSSGALNTITITPASNGAIWFACAPATVPAGAVVTVTTSSGDVYTKTTKFPWTLEAGKILPISLSGFTRYVEPLKVTYSLSDFSGGSSGSGSALEVTQHEPITLSAVGNKNNTYVQIYSGNTITITGAIIKKVVLSATNGYIKTWSASDNGNVGIEGNIATWTGSQTSITLTNSASGQARLTSIEVYYEMGGNTNDDRESPTFKFSVANFTYYVGETEETNLPTLSTSNDITVANITYRSSDTNVIDYVDDLGWVVTAPSTITEAQTATVYADFTGDENYTEAHASYALTVTKHKTTAFEWRIDGSKVTSIRISVGAEEGSYTLPTLNQNDFTATYSSSNEEIALIDETDGTILLDTTNPGTVKITANGTRTAYFDAVAEYTIEIYDDSHSNSKTEVSVDFSTLGYSNQQEISSPIAVDENISVSFDKGTNSNAVKYFTTGPGIRVYGGGSMTVSASSGKTIVGISITFGTGDGSNEISVDAGSYTFNNWTGSSSSVVFSIGGTSGHRRIKALTVLYN